MNFMLFRVAPAVPRRCAKGRRRFSFPGQRSTRTRGMGVLMADRSMPCSGLTCACVDLWVLSTESFLSPQYR